MPAPGNPFRCMAYTVGSCLSLLVRDRNPARRARADEWTRSGGIAASGGGAAMRGVASPCDLGLSLGEVQPESEDVCCTSASSPTGWVRQVPKVQPVQAKVRFPRPSSLQIPGRLPDEHQAGSRAPVPDEHQAGSRARIPQNSWLH
eukprot:gene13151-biopygen10372